MTLAEKPPSQTLADGALERLFVQIYDEHFDYIWRLLRRFGARERDQEDLAHDVFVAVHRSLERYDQARPLRPWLFGIAFRVVSDYRRKASFEREVPVDEHPTASSAPQAIAHLEAVERRALVQHGLERLPLEQRAVFVMHEMEGVAVVEIARALGISDNTCYSRLRLARERFTKSVRAIAARQAHHAGSD